MFKALGQPLSDSDKLCLPKHIYFAYGFSFFLLAVESRCGSNVASIVVIYLCSLKVVSTVNLNLVFS